MPEHADNSTTELQDIPDELKVPDGNVLLLRAYGKGVQRSCSRATGMKGISLLFTSRDPAGKPWTVA